MKVNKKIIIVFLVAIVIIVGIIFAIKWQSEKPIRVVKKFIEASQENDKETLEKLFDLKGFSAWLACDRKADDFKEEYDKIEDEDVEDEVKSDIGHDDIEEVYTIIVRELDYSGAHTLEIEDKPEMEKIAPSMYKVKANVKAKVDDETVRAKLEFILYKNKIIICEWD